MTAHSGKLGRPQAKGDEGGDEQDVTLHRTPMA
eukprot:CAMPEP_0113722102 /NCGR_PEP_ID=MMETSP0038_2-20120614/37538_1 /TAXON_ID=2898 /ORGANISM="Cryptomonas paramecium" /LENGTH=32 /DNA_ID=CAMNT_0000651257 /DNA_START=118 /DNA_END=214 /DNA_ORIENTATION=- /assembly_acc=CAM_ASM_000170